MQFCRPIVSWKQAILPRRRRKEIVFPSFPVTIGDIDDHIKWYAAYDFLFNSRLVTMALSRSVFSKRERITLRLLIAVAIPSVCCLSSVCLSVTLVHPTQPVEIFGNFFSPYDSPGTLVFWCQKSLVGTPLSPWNWRSKWRTPFQTAKFRPISAHSASTVIASEKSSIITYRKSTTHFPTSRVRYL